MKNLMDFSDSALSRTEMKSVKGGGCGSTCFYGGGAREAGANYGNNTKAQALNQAAECVRAGFRAYWCCARC